MKTLSTLVKDIYDLMSRDTPLSNDQAEKIGQGITTMLKKRLASPPEKRPAISMSNFGTKCLRHLWYRHHMPEKAEALAPHTKIKFLYGDILEELLLGLADASGHEVKGKQDRLHYGPISGSRDSVIDGVTVDVKSANSRSFEKFKHHELETKDPFNYIDQLSLYVNAAKDDPLVQVKGEGAFLAIDQELGHVVLDTYRINKKDYKEEIDQKLSVVVQKEEPERHFKPVPDGFSGNMMLCTECKYCPFKEHCHRDVNDGRGLIKFIFSNGPRWYTKIVKPPKPRKDYGV